MNRYFFISIGCHILLLTIFVLSFHLATPLAVIENTNKTDTISAVILGDTAKSKILPNKPNKIAEEKSVEKIKKLDQVEEIKKTEKVMIAKKEMLKKIENNKPKDLLAKNLLAEMEKDIKKTKEQHAIKPNKKLSNQFTKKLKEQAELSFRQSLLDEPIKLSAKEQRDSQGEVNKYKALILQAISEQWVIPIGANKHLSCELFIRLARDGRVLEVRIAKTSGDASLDSSARAAVLKASPLPVPKDQSAFSVFRHFALKVKPENVI